MPITQLQQLPIFCQSCLGYVAPLICILKQVQDFSISFHLLILKMFFTTPFADLCSQVDDKVRERFLAFIVTLPERLSTRVDFPRMVLHLFQWHLLIIIKMKRVSSRTA